MIVTVTSLKLKSPWKFFLLSYRALQIIKQLRATNCLQYKSKGFWTRHYTLSLWNTQEDAREFARTGAHLDAMKKSGEVAEEIRVLSYEANAMPSWKEALNRLNAGGRILKF